MLDLSLLLRTFSDWRSVRGLKGGHGACAESGGSALPQVTSPTSEGVWALDDLDLTLDHPHDLDPFSTRVGQKRGSG